MRLSAQQAKHGNAPYNLAKFEIDNKLTMR